jgi:hypothetical protein
MKVREVDPNVDTAALLAGAQFVDAYRVAIGDAAIDARQATERMVKQQPRWIDALLTLRNLLVAPFGLKTSGAGESGDIVGILPVVSQTPERLVAGFNDSYLDFRIVVDVTAADSGRSVTATTLVLTHNWLGRAYLATILPFHRLIVRTMLRQVAA